MIASLFFLWALVLGPFCLVAGAVCATNRRADRNVLDDLAGVAPSGDNWQSSVPAPSLGHRRLPPNDQEAQ